jgi:hypothetical protein
MRSYKYKLIRILFRDETLKLTISLDININPSDNKDIKVELKFTHEFTLKEFTNPLVFSFEMMSDSEKGSKINQLHTYFLKNSIQTTMSDDSSENEYIIEDSTSSDDDEYRLAIDNLNNNDWSEHKTIKGDSYLWNKVTGESVWKETDGKPYDSNEWIEHVTEYGHNYWWNKITDESIWENPYDINSPGLTEIKIEDKLLRTNTKNITHPDVITEKIVSHLRMMILYNDKDISFKRNIVFLIVEMIKFIDQFLISGDDKKSLLIESLKICLESENFSENEYNLIVDVVCPELIDILISIDRHETKLTKQSISCCFVNPWIK